MIGSEVPSVMSLAALSPLSQVSWNLPVYQQAHRFWAFRGDFKARAAFRASDGDEVSGLNTSDSVVAELEMYGGPGLGSNAGGVRCANYDGYQVKGTGPSVLAGPGTDKWHRHGALSLQDAVRETLIGEVFHIASPHGAVRALGISDLGFRFATEVGVDKLPGSAPRALLYRELSVRMAHFMRSSFMNVGAELAHRELMRMRDGIPRFVDWLCRDLGAVGFDEAGQGLLMVFERLMNQVAVLRTKRLVHGSLIPSNFCIDGRLLDFTTSTAVSTLQPVMVSLGGLTSQQQHHQVLRALPDALFYLTKYDSRCRVSRHRYEETSALLVARLNSLHHSYLMREHLGLFGFPLQDAMALPVELRNALLEALIAGIGCGSTEGHLYFGGDEHPMLPQSGRDDVFALVASAIAEVCVLQLPMCRDYRPAPEVFPRSVQEAMVSACRAASGLLHRGDLSAEERGMAWLIRSMQLNADLEPLYRRNLDGEIHRACMNGDDVGQFIKQALADWAGVFDCPMNGRVSLQGWLTAENASLTPQGQLQVGDRMESPFALSELQPAERVRPRHRWLFEVARLNRARVVATAG